MMRDLLNEIATFESLTVFREPLLKSILSSINIPAGSRGLDAGCAIGSTTQKLGDAVGIEGEVVGLDLSKDYISYAKKEHQTKNVHFLEGDITDLPFQADSFDWVWSMDAAWPGSKESGCPAEVPTGIIREFHRVLKPGGSLYLFFWSSQKLLPGYPILESRLNTTSSATAPFTKKMNPWNHTMNGRFWLEKVGFHTIEATTYLGDITAPLSENDRMSLLLLFQMLWGESEREVEADDWKEFKKIGTPGSADFVLDNPHYYGFYTYTLFRGMK